MLITDKEQLKKYAAAYRVWQGIPGIARTKGGRIFVSLYSGNIKETYGNFVGVIESRDGEHYSEPIAVAFKEGRFRCFDLIDVQSIIVKAGDAFCDQTGDGDIGALTKPGSELINGQGGGGDLGEGCRCAATGEQCQYQNQREEDGSIFHNDYLHI